ncbi:DUF1428 domain-containing protein [Novosphingobium sp.]|uniref:DUF1428 domain-containing protein n=1 Tax=Novosphingobium sp. TaxID=1874826 RepID=UPI0025CD64C8|nr:DUF1428 domain-containing protein [Novosphingobium sp.]
MSYFDIMVYPATISKKDEIIDFAQRMDTIFMEYGAMRIVETWSDDVPHGTTTDYFRAVAAGEGEAVAVGLIEWPDKATRDAGFAQMHNDERMQGPMPFDGKRMIFGGFSPFLDLKA